MDCALFPQMTIYITMRRIILSSIQTARPGLKRLQTQGLSTCRTGSQARKLTRRQVCTIMELGILTLGTAAG